MAHFYGTVKGPKGEASRLGSKVSGLTTVAASWHGAIKTHLYHDPQSGADSVRIERLSWPSGNVETVIYEGPVALAGGPTCQRRVG